MSLNLAMPDASAFGSHQEYVSRYRVFTIVLARRRSTRRASGDAELHPGFKSVPLDGSPENRNAQANLP